MEAKEYLVPNCPGKRGPELQMGISWGGIMGEAGQKATGGDETQVGLRENGRNRETWVQGKRDQKERHGTLPASAPSKR